MTILKTAVRFGAMFLAVTGMAVSAQAADLYGGSLKDDPIDGPAPSHRSCYVRGDLGYSWSQEPDAMYRGNFPQENFDNVSLGNDWFGEAGLGCASGVRGLRGDITIGSHRGHDFTGHIPTLSDPNDPITTSVSSVTALFNLYYDLGDWGGFVPYVGAGVGASFNKMDDVLSTDSPNTQFGDDETSLAWSVSAGMAYRLTDSLSFDLGYRYIHLGDAHSQSIDDALGTNPILEINDMAAHEIKMGLRFDLGSY